MFRSCSSTYDTEYSSYYDLSSQYSSYCGRSSNALKTIVPKEGYQFGQFKDTHNWVQCDSKSRPGKVYFFNVRSNCTTWERPVPDDVPLQHFSHEARLYDSDCDLDDPSMVISDNEQEVKNESVETGALSFDVFRKVDIIESKDQDVFQKLYYGIRMPDDSDFEYIDEDFDPALQLSNFKGIFDTSEKMPAKYIETTQADTIPNEMSENNPEYSLSISDFLEVEILNSTEPVKIKSVKLQNTYDTSSSELEEEFELPQHYVPRLHRIQTTDLITRKSTNKNKPRKTNGKITKIEPTIYNMYGTTTVNYNSDYECQQEKAIPSHIKVTNLSDTSISTFPWPKGKRAEENLNKFFRRYRVARPEMPEINLSESSSSSSCSSDCSCCSSDSDSSGSTPSDCSSDPNSEL